MGREFKCVKPIMCREKDFYNYGTTAGANGMSYKKAMEIVASIQETSADLAAWWRRGYESYRPKQKPRVSYDEAG